MLNQMKKIYGILFGVYSEDSHIVIKLFGLKICFKHFFMNRIEMLCCISNLSNLRGNNVHFPHPIGIVINKNATIGKNVSIFQNVTIGSGKFNKETGKDAPTIKDNVTIFANAVLIGGITIGENSVVGAGSVVINDVPPNTVVAGNPAKIIKKINKQ